jgi:hypothetical protein
MNSPAFLHLISTSHKVIAIWELLCHLLNLVHPVLYFPEHGPSSDTKWLLARLGIAAIYHVHSKICPICREVHSELTAIFSTGDPVCIWVWWVMLCFTIEENSRLYGPSTITATLTHWWLVARLTHRDHRTSQNFSKIGSPRTLRSNWGLGMSADVSATTRGVLRLLRCSTVWLVHNIHSCINTRPYKSSYLPTWHQSHSLTENPPLGT